LRQTAQPLALNAGFRTVGTPDRNRNCFSDHEMPIGTRPAMSWGESRARPGRTEGGRIVSGRRGFTLVEIAVALVTVSLLMLIGFPKVQSAIARNNVRSSRTMVVNMLAKARASATIGNRKTWLKIGGNRAWILARPRRNIGLGDADTLGVVENINSRYGTTVTLTSVDSIGFDPRGLGSGWTGTTGSITVSKGSYSDVIRVDGKGRVVK
jgi:prepilin-type N-terminal cleavage/methylation domain-containing protein